MEKTRNSVIDLFKDLFKNFCLVISKLVNDGVVDDAQLTGELAKDPMKALEEYKAFVKSVEEPVQSKTKARTPNHKKVQTCKASAVKRPTRRATPREAPEPTIEPVNDDEREI